MQDDDIPVLTEVLHTPIQAVEATPELIAMLIAQLKPQLEGEIEKSLMQKIKHSMRQELLDHLLSESANIQKASQAYLSSALTQQSDQHAERLSQMQRDVENTLKMRVQDEVTAAQQNIIEQTTAFVDRARADMTTEIPKMLYSNVEIIKADLDQTFAHMQAQGVSEMQNKLMEALPQLENALTERLQATLSNLEKITVENAEHALQSRISRLHEDILVEHQANLAQELAAVYKELTQQTQVELSVYLDALQLQSQQQLQQKLGDTFPAIYQGLSNELSATLKTDFETLAESTKNDYKLALNAELPAVQEVLANKVVEILNDEMPKIEQSTIANIRSEIEHLLESVRLVFSK